MRVSTVILPHERWARARSTWERAEDLGFHAAYTYDHLSWRSFRDGPWFDAMTTLAAATVVTSSIRLGPMVTSPNFRHPVPLAKELLTLDDLSRGRLVVGVGSGGTGFDAEALGGTPWTTEERSERFTEFVTRLDQLLCRTETTESGRYYSAHQVVRYPAPLVSPRPPFVVSAMGPKALELAAAFGQGWVTIGARPDRGFASAEATVTHQMAGLDAALDARGRDRSSVERVFLDGFTDERPLASVDAFVDLAGRLGRIGFTELIVHWPIPGSQFEVDQALFERIATEGVDQLDR
jgi:alkanesulfonate monooxygenase SsuD/methylene tetrahydromethanopterin reductase-like flavin-dependent oxidoreductase (luciferase family)